MTPERRAELDRKFLKDAIRRYGVEDLLRGLKQLDEASAQTGVPVTELKEYGDELLHELIQDHFAQKAQAK